jgi:hypothetical protein
MSAMFSDLTARLVASFVPPLAELSSPGPQARVNPTSLQLALIGAGTLAAYSWIKRWRAARRNRIIETGLNSLPVASAPVAAPHYAQSTQPAVSEPAEHAA